MDTKLEAEVKFYTDAVEEIFTVYPDIIRYLCGIENDDWKKYYVVWDEYHKNHQNIKLCYGASKIVLIGENCEYVCKMPRFGDECGREVEIYQYAVINQLAKFFAPCMKMGECHGMPLYLMKKMDVGVDAMDYTSKSISYYDDDEFELIWEAIRINWEEDCEKLGHFLNFYNVNDIHDENIGYDSEGHIVIFDYSGYGGRNRSSSEYKKNIWFEREEDTNEYYV